MTRLRVSRQNKAKEPVRAQLVNDVAAGEPCRRVFRPLRRREALIGPEQTTG